VVIDVEDGGAANADFAHLTGDEGGVRGHTAAGGDDALGGDHAAEILRGGLDAGEQDFFTLVGGLDAAIGVEIDLAAGRAGAGGQARGDGHGLANIGGVEHGSEELFELVRRVAEDGGLPVDELLLDHVDGELERGHGGAFAIARLEHVDLLVWMVNSKSCTSLKCFSRVARMRPSSL